MRNNFVIITPGRTGSNHFSSMLNSHGDVLCHGEIFAEDQIAFANENKYYFKNLNLRNYFPFLFAKYHLALNKNFKACGFRLLMDQNAELIKKIINDKKIKKIFLLRRNELKRFVSTKLAENKKIWHVKNDGQQEIFKKIDLDITEFYENCLWQERELKKYSKILENTKQKYLLIYYEDLNKAECIDSVFAYLNLKNRKLNSIYLKQHIEDLSDLVNNYSEVSSALSNSDIKWMLETNRGRN